MDHTRTDRWCYHTNTDGSGGVGAAPDPRIASLPPRGSTPGSLPFFDKTSWYTQLHEPYQRGPVNDLLGTGAALEEAGFGAKPYSDVYKHMIIMRKPSEEYERKARVKVAKKPMTKLVSFRDRPPPAAEPEEEAPEGIAAGMEVVGWDFEKEAREKKAEEEAKEAAAA
ncbi:hypothetical protein TeGR_g7407 [Tetraparma gracilis]|uniref:Uncharacterized protein n=1 Tax=Tetraparma gracilis TaxID=2962635 RepID=A0ABQ6MUS0_9STRA|nr:hypothetical protein TeGR_g7407 [Tetraparma gracilis]